MTERQGIFFRRFPGLASIARNGTFLIGGEWIEAILRALYALLIARWLGPYEYGVWSYALAASGFAITLSMLGTDLLLPTRVGKDGDGARNFLHTSLAVRIGILILLAAGLAVYAYAGESGTFERFALLLLVPAVLARGSGLWFRTLAVGLERVGPVMRWAVAIRLAEVAVGSAILMASMDVLALLALHSLTWLVELVVLRRVTRSMIDVRAVIDRGELSAVLGKGAIAGLAVSLASFLFAGPVIMLRHLIEDLTVVGQFGLAMQLAMFAVMAVQGALGASQAVLSRAHAGEDTRVRHFGTIVLVTCLLSAVPLYLAALWLGPPVIDLLTGGDYAQAGALLPACLVLALVAVAPNGYWQVLVLRGRFSIGVGAGIAAVAAFLGLAEPAVDNFGATGIAYAAIAGSVMRAAILGIAATVSRPPGQNPT